MKLTTASYRRPNGKNIHRFPDAKESDEWGVMPDPGFRIRLPDGEMLALMRDRRQRNILRPATASATGGEPAVTDRQLQAALKYLEVEMAKAGE